MENMLRIAKRPALSTHPRATVQQVCETMIEAQVGALVVVDEGRLVGIISERDVVSRVVVPRLDPSTTKVSEVMTRDVRTGRAEMRTDEAMKIMEAGHFRHLPIVDAAGRVLGVLSMRHVLRQRVEELAATSESLANYLSADGPGG